MTDVVEVSHDAGRTWTVLKDGEEFLAWDVIKLGVEIKAWQERNFPARTFLTTAGVLFGEAAEVFEIALKRQQRISPEKTTDEKLHSEIGDTAIALIALCEQLDLDLMQLTEDRWQVVQQRDWVAARLADEQAKLREMAEEMRQELEGPK